ncbi:MAG TPA: hypothetical protein VHY59_08300 [Chthoniobacterales bacterium]|nr:hypothetical protein [Chthoniobacterales bacterium]
MPFKSDKSNVGPEMWRWSLFKASREFGVGEHTLGQKLAEAGELAGPDECYATRQILKSLYGEVYRERLRKIKEEADGFALRNAADRSELLGRQDLEAAFLQVALAIKEIIQSSDLNREAQADVLRVLGSIPVVIKDRATDRARARDHGENGNGNGSSEKRKKGRPRKAVAK